MRGALKTVALCLAAALCGAVGALAAPYDPGLSFKPLTKRDGLPQMSVMAIERDSEGFMWFATRSGLCRYDGAEFVVFNQSNSALLENYVSKLTADRNGNLWIGTTNGLNRMDVNTGEISRYRISGGIRSLIRDSRGRIWGSNSKVLFMVDPVTDGVFSVDVALTPICLAELPDTSCFLAGTAKGLFVLNRQDGAMAEVRSFPSDLNIQTVLRDRRSNYWVGTRSDGLFLLDRELRVVRRFTVPEINNDYVRALAEDRDGNIVVGTYDGINVIRNAEGDIRSYRLGADGQNDALTFFSLISLCCCPDGTLWAGSYVGGVNFTNPFRESFLSVGNPGSELEGIVGNVGPMACGDDGLWIGMEGDGLLFRTPGGRYERVRIKGMPQGYRANIVSSLFRNGGKIYAGFNDGTVAVIDESSRRTISLRTIVKDCPVIAISRDSDGTMYFGTWGVEGSGDLHVLDPGSEVLRSGFPDPATGLPLFKNITSILPAGDGSVYISERDGGVSKYDIRTGEYSNSKLAVPGSGYRTASVNAMIRASDGMLYAATHRYGLVRVRPSLETDGFWSVPQGLPSCIAHSIVESEDGAIWVTTPDAVSSVNPATGVVRTWPLSSDGEFNRRSAVLFAGNVMMGAGKSIVRLSPGRVVPASRAAAPRIVSISADGSGISRTDILSRQVRFKSLTHFSVYFRSLDYSSEGSISYSYRIDGLDSNWMPLGGNPRVNMANFHSGRYVFRTKAFSGPDDKVGTEGESFSFRVMAPLWRRWWMLLLYVSAVSLMIWSVLSFRKAKTTLDDERAELRRICESLTLNSPAVSGTSPDAEFMKKVYACINSHIGDPSLNVDMICAEVGASRTGLYYKIKKITDLAPMDFVRKVRMDVASTLLLGGSSSVADVAEKVGFGSASYFSTAFRNSFGMSPSEYINEYKQLPIQSINNKTK